MSDVLPPRRRFRIAVLANSTAILMLPRRATRRLAPYPELLERRLLDAGINVRVESHSRLYDMAYEGARRWSTVVEPTAPDVLILNYGILEAQADVVPTRLSRHPPLVRRYQRWAGAMVGERSWRLGPERLRAEILRTARSAAAAGTLVLVLDVFPAGPRLEHSFPGMTARVERVHDELKSVVDEMDDPDVRLVDARRVLDEVGGVGALPDGLHLVPEGHLRLSRVLADEVGPWLRARGAG